MTEERRKRLMQMIAEMKYHYHPDVDSYLLPPEFVDELAPLYIEFYDMITKSSPARRVVRGGDEA
jgi:hypothetical protein